MYSTILLPTDGSESAEKAGKHALWIAGKSGAEILVLNIFELYSPSVAALPISAVPGSNADMYLPLKEEAEKIVEDFKTRLLNHNAQEVVINTIVREGRPHVGILKTIQELDVDLTVMGASGRHGLDRITLGSVTERVVRESKTPVMVIP